MKLYTARIKNRVGSISLSGPAQPVLFGAPAQQSRVSHNDKRAANFFAALNLFGMIVFLTTDTICQNPFAALSAEAESG